MERSEFNFNACDIIYLKISNGVEEKEIKLYYSNIRIVPLPVFKISTFLPLHDIMCCCFDSIKGKKGSLERVKNCIIEYGETFNEEKFFKTEGTGIKVEFCIKDIGGNILTITNSIFGDKHEFYMTINNKKSKNKSETDIIQKNIKKLIRSGGRDRRYINRDAVNNYQNYNL